MSIQLCLRVEVSLSPACSHVHFEDLVKRLVETEHSNAAMTLENHVIVISGFNIHVKSSVCYLINAINGCDVEGYIQWEDIDKVQASVSIAHKNMDDSKYSSLPIGGGRVFTREELQQQETITNEATIGQKQPSYIPIANKTLYPSVCQQETLEYNDTDTASEFKQRQKVTAQNSLDKPTAQWFIDADLGGMTNEIDFVLKYIFRARFRQGSKASKGTNGGLLIYGPPGSGKTYLAHAVKQVWERADKELTTRFVRGPELFSDLVGKTEEAVRELFEDALENLDDYEASNQVELRQHLVIIDEIDAMFGTRGMDSSGGAADRATAMFISMMDDIRLRKNLFVIATTNRYDMVDPAVSRSGRLGLHLQIAVMQIEDKVKILQMQLEKHQPGQQVNQDIINCFRSQFSHMQIAMITDAFTRAIIEADDEDSEYLSLHHFQAACETILDDKTDPQGRFREVLRLHHEDDWTLPQSIDVSFQEATSALCFSEDQIAVMITGTDIQLRLKVTLHLYSAIKQNFDKMLYLNPSMLGVATDPKKRLKLASNQILDFCHYKYEKKLLILDDIQLFGGDEGVRRELLRILANISTKYGQILSGHQSRREGCLKVILCINPEWKLELEGIGIRCDGINIIDSQPP